MKNLRKNFERFCYRHQNKGIRNLMLYIVICNAVVFVVGHIDPSNLLYQVLAFDRSKILQGQVWRLLTYVIIPTDYSVLGLLLSLFFDYYIGKMLEGQWGTFRFNLYYFSGVLLTNVAALVLGYNADAYYLNLSLMLAFATVFSETRINLLFIPLKMKYLAWVYFAMLIFEAFYAHISYTLFTACALLNYFLFFGADIVRVLPDFMQPRQKWKPINGDYAPRQPAATKQKTAAGKGKVVDFPYRHKCTVCGRTDTDSPYLEFRYCSKCNGYYCYCLDHINDHAHVE